MSQDEALDVIVVGAGLAGLACAFEVASAGLQVAVLERGDLAGAKNVSGGRLYLEPVRALCGELLRDAPFERPVVSESLVLTDDQGSLTLRLDPGPVRAPSFTVLRARLDSHLANRVAAKGGLVLAQQRADGLLREGPRVVGVKVGKEELRAQAVVAADGVLSFLAQEAGLRPSRPAHSYAVGVKEILELPPAAIEARFNLAPGQGASRLFLGHITRGLPGGGFLYTNRDSLSLGLVFNLGPLRGWTADDGVADVLEQFKARPEIAALIAGGKTVEYSAHLIPEGGHPALPAPGIPGLLLAGDAAGLLLNTGFMIRGMDLALASGALAGRSVVQSLQAGLGPAECLDRYRKALADSFVMKQLRAHRKAPGVLALSRLYQRYPQGLIQGARELLEVGADGGTPKLGRAFRRLRKQVLGWRGLRDLWRLSRM